MEVGENADVVVWQMAALPVLGIVILLGCVVYMVCLYRRYKREELKRVAEPIYMPPRDPEFSPYHELSQHDVLGQASLAATSFRL